MDHRRRSSQRRGGRRSHQSPMCLAICMYVYTYIYVDMNICVHTALEMYARNVCTYMWKQNS